MRTTITIIVDHDPNIITADEVVKDVRELVTGFYFEMPADDHYVDEIDIRHEGSVG